MPEYVTGELYAEMVERAEMLENAIRTHFEAHEIGETGAYAVSHVADLPLWAVLTENDD